MKATVSMLTPPTPLPAAAGLTSAPTRKAEPKAASKKKKSSSLQQPSQPKQPSTSRGRTQTSDEPIGTTGTQQLAPAAAKKLATTEATRATASKKHSSKQQTFKITREKERKEKLSKHATAVNAAADAAAAQRPTESDSNAKVTSGLEQDTVKSRNHKLFLAPSRQSPSSLSAAPSWGHAHRGPASAGDAHSSTVADRLHEEILEYAEYTKATVEAMTVHIEEMVANVRGCVLSLWPKSKIEPFGSYSTGIWLPSSDVDLVILGVVEIHDRMLTAKCLRQLAKALESQSWVESIVVLDTAKIPVLKLVTAESTVPIDITFESTATHSGLLARDLIKRYAAEMPELYPLAVIFKQLLRERDLNDAYTGGLSSYSIVLMITHFLLLSRYGERCFKAAAMFAAGMPLPRPADLLAEEARLRSTQRIAGSRPSSNPSSEDKAPETTTSSAQSALSSSFACVVARAKGVKRPASEAGRSASSSSGSDANGKPAQPFSYAAVAAGIVKLGAPEPKPAPAPVSYAAAVAAPAPVSRSQASVSLNKSSDSALDAISVTSSTADTEDSSSCSDSTTASAHEGEADDDASATRVDLQEEERYVSLGERTMAILEFYGIIFDYRKNGLSVRDGGYVYRLADHVGASGDLVKKLPALVIEDPIHPDRNVSASSFGFSRVVAVFEDAYYALKYFRPTRFTPSALSCLLSTSGHTPHHHQQSLLGAASSSSAWTARKPFTQVVNATPAVSLRAFS
ncbi:hypothetical protein P43SY_009130 [Pythium insidiosum]|uniref:Polymerase nucleotidyl transferase domain-containing protein n=1 Tax=Pythium insidiosum TaxID=114742 RepID=A0AAD5Q677_PYTIN|nr:hypothetical protein P43SY_009130 [Pythium insidiosum]